jgi:hypothetical protein
MTNLRTSLTIFGLLSFSAAPACLGAGPSAAAVAAFNAYVAGVEARLDRQHQSSDHFLAPLTSIAGSQARLLKGDAVIEKIKPTPDLPGAILHHWRGTAFIPGAHAADFDRLLRDFAGYPKYFSPQVVQAKVLTEDGDRVQASMRVRQKHVLTVVMDTAYDIAFGRLDARHGYSISRSTRIAEIDAAGTPSERPLTPTEAHGFLWRLNTYWSFEERDGGLYLQIESVSLTRSIPTGLAWLIGPFVESVPRESLEFTLCSVCTALQNKPKAL